MSQMEEIVEIIKKPNLTEKDWERFYELRQHLINQELIRQVDNLLEVRYMEG